MGNKLIFLKKYQWSDNNLNQRDFLLTTTELIGKYNGFEGEGILYFEDENIIFNMPKTRSSYEDFSEKSNNYLLLYLFQKNLNFPLQKKFKKIGYDYGSISSEEDRYSSIFQEILFGRQEELVHFFYKLNDNLLFSTKEIAEEYVKVHHQLSKEGKDVEWEEYMEIYEVWKYFN